MLELTIKLQGLMTDTFESLASAVSQAQLDAFQNACNAIVNWLVQGHQDGSFSMLEVASRAAHWDSLSAALGQAVANGYLTVLQVAQIAANFIATYS
jgi:hypothetical protein